MGDLPNAYVYAANNPSESIIAKRRGYGTIVSHNVPPYGRCAPAARHACRGGVAAAPEDRVLCYGEIPRNASLWPACVFM